MRFGVDCMAAPLPRVVMRQPDRATFEAGIIPSKAGALDMPDVVMLLV